MAGRRRSGVESGERNGFGMRRNESVTLHVRLGQPSRLPVPRLRASNRETRRVMGITRKQFFGAVAGGGVLLLHGGCGGGGGYGSSGATMAGTSSCTPTIDANHGHVLSIAVTELDSSTPKTYDITGTADHGHSVTLSVAQLQQLKAGTIATATSTLSVAAATAPHTHAVSVSCIVY
jgi:hypothetical protein